MFVISLKVSLLLFSVISRIDAINTLSSYICLQIFFSKNKQLRRL